jgi:hypothetical protein
MGDPEKVFFERRKDLVLDTTLWYLRQQQITAPIPNKDRLVS